MSESTFTFESKSRGTGKGFLTEKRKIKEVVDMSGEMHPNILKPFEVMLKVQFEQGPKDKFEPYPFYVFGNYERKDGAVVGKGSAFKIELLLTAAGLPFTVDRTTYRLLPSVVEQLVGKEIATLSYIYDAKKNDEGVWKAKWTMWDLVGSETAQLEKDFEWQLKNKKIQNFKPNAVAEKEAGGTTADFDPSAGV